MAEIIGSRQPVGGNCTSEIRLCDKVEYPAIRLGMRSLYFSLVSCNRVLQLYVSPPENAISLQLAVSALSRQKHQCCAAAFQELRCG